MLFDIDPPIACIHKKSSHIHPFVTSKVNAVLKGGTPIDKIFLRAFHLTLANATVPALPATVDANGLLRQLNVATIS
jgi:hypothetical protein